MPISPEPGTTSRPSSVNTFVLAPIVNLAVVGAEPGALIEPANPTPSLEPSESKQIMLPRAISACFVSVDHITPELMMSCSDEMSYGAPVGFGLFERAHHRLRERVADDRHLRDALALHGLPQLVRVEGAADERDERGADEQRLERRERAGAVHQRRRGQVHALDALGDDLGRERARLVRDR